MNERPNEREYQKKMVEQMKQDPAFMAQVKQGMKDVKKGKVVAWEDVKKELGIEPVPKAEPKKHIEGIVHTCYLEQIITGGCTPDCKGCKEEEVIHQLANSELVPKADGIVLELGYTDYLAEKQWKEDLAEANLQHFAEIKAIKAELEALKDAYSQTKPIPNMVWWNDVEAIFSKHLGGAK